MMDGKKEKRNPGRLFGLCTVAMLVLAPILTILSESGASGGEQRLFTTLAYMLLLTAAGAAVISILTPFFYKQWFKENRLAGIFLIVITVIPVLGFIKAFYFETRYSSIESTRYIGKDTVEIKKEFYDNENKKLRSVSYKINGQKDSVWTTYDKQGKVIKQVVY